MTQLTSNTNDSVLEEIATLIPEGNILKLPSSSLSHYPQIKKLLLKAGGKYKRNTFVFTECAKNIQQQLCGGETLDDKKTFQFFPTPRPLVLKAIHNAQLEPGHSWLEPGAGDGAIAEEAFKISTEGTLVEINERLIRVLESKGFSPTHMDFLEYNDGLYDRIIANPPFHKNLDIKHIYKMYEHLAPNGVLVSFASTSWINGSQRAQKEFRDWLSEVNANIENIEAGAFKASGTNIASVLITIHK